MSLPPQVPSSQWSEQPFDGYHHIQLSCHTLHRSHDGLLYCSKLYHSHSVPSWCRVLYNNLYPAFTRRRFCPKTASLIFLPLLLSNRHSIVSILVLGLYTIPAVLILKLSCSSFTIHLSYFTAQQQACIQIAVTIYTQACPHTSLFCFLLYQLSLWWVKYRAQPEAINP